MEEVEEWLACVWNDAKDTPFIQLKETQHLVCTVLGDDLDNLKLVQTRPLVCTLEG